MSSEQDRGHSSSSQAPLPASSGMQASVQSVAAEAQHEVGETVDQVREQGKSLLASQKDRVADTVGSVAHALRETAKQLQESTDAPVAAAVERVAERAEHLSTHLRQRDVDELLEETASFARRQPALFFGGAFVFGLVAARFLKSARPEQARVTSAPSPSSTGPRRSDGGGG